MKTYWNWLKRHHILGTWTINSKETDLQLEQQAAFPMGEIVTLKQSLVGREDRISCEQVTRYHKIITLLVFANLLFIRFREFSGYLSTRPKIQSTTSYRTASHQFET
jgi:hypothetical protein